MKRILVFIFVISLIFAIFSCSTGSKDLHVVQVNSLQGRIFTVTKEHEGVKIKEGGISMISAKINELKEAHKGEDFILIANSNFIHGSPEAFFTSGKVVIQSLNTLNFDMLVVGHRELYLGGMGPLEELARLADFPFISANIVKKDGSRFEYIKPYYIDEKNSFAVIGLTSYRVISQNIRENVENIGYIPISLALDTYVKELKEMGIKNIAAAGDFVFDPSPGGGGDKEFKELVQNDGVDLFFTQGKKIDDYNRLYVLKNAGFSDKKICPALRKGLVIGHYHRDRGGDSETYSMYTINSNEVGPDENLKEFLSGLTVTINKISGQNVGRVGNTITHDFTAESALGNLVTDVIRDYTKTDVSVLNSGAVREGFSPGQVTKMEIYTAVPFDDIVVTVEMTGAQILKLLESSCSFKHSKSFLQVSGMSFTYAPDREAGSRVINSSVLIGGAPIELAKTYTLSTTHYIFSGGDSYSEFKEFGLKPLAIDKTYYIRGIIEKYIREAGTVSSVVEGRIIKGQ